MRLRRSASLLTTSLFALLAACSTVTSPAPSAADPGSQNEDGPGGSHDGTTSDARGDGQTAPDGGPSTSHSTVPTGVVDTSFGNKGSMAIDDSLPKWFATMKDGTTYVAAVPLKPPSGLGGQAFQVSRFTKQGKVDGAFGDGGARILSIPYEYGDLGRALVLDDGRLLLAMNGHTGYDTGYTETIFSRLLANGDFDSSFGTKGSTSFKIAPHTYYGDISVLADGRSVITYRATLTRIARLDTKGTVDSSFGTNSEVTTPVQLFSLRTQSDGKIVMWGRDDHQKNILMRFLADGSVDTSFGDGGTATLPDDGSAADYLIQSDGRILVVGTILVPMGDTEIQRMRVLRLDASGKLDAAFGDDGVAVLTGDPAKDAWGIAMAIDSSGRIYVGGSIGTTKLNPQYPAMSYQARALTRLTSAGVVDTAFGDKGWVTQPATLDDDDMIAQLALTDDGRIIAGIVKGIAGNSAGVFRGDRILKGAIAAYR
jgi:uncharacterized delta-60 repeat protein